MSDTASVLKLGSCATLHCKALLQSLAVLCDRSSHAESPLLYFSLRKHLCMWIGRVCRCISSPNIHRVPESWLELLWLGKKKSHISPRPTAWPSALTPLNPDVGQPQRVTHLQCEGSNPWPFGRTLPVSQLHPHLCLFYFRGTCWKAFFASREGSLSEASAQ